MKIFGFNLFKHKRKVGVMYDFAKFGLARLSERGMLGGDILLTTRASTADATSGNTTINYLTSEKKLKEKIEKTPKELFQMKALHDNKFFIHVENDYLNKQIAVINKKLSFYEKPKKNKRNTDMEPAGPTTYGRQELESLVERLKNRKNIYAFNKMLEKYHTQQINLYLKFYKIINI